MSTLLTEASLRELAEVATLRRGKAYFVDGSVDERRVYPRRGGGVEIKGVVYGTTRYRVSLFVDNEGKPDFYDCTCPYVWGGACKHVVALGYAYLADIAAGEVNAVDVVSTEGEDAAGTRARREPPSTEIYRFDGITLRVSRSAKTDTLIVDGTATYGSLEIPLGADDRFDEGMAKDSRGRKVTYRLERDRSAEAACIRAVENRSQVPMVNGRFLVHGDRAYVFLKRTLPALRESYEVVVDASAANLIEIASTPVESEWHVGSSGVDLLSFSVDWHCGKMKLSTEDLRKMVLGWTPFMRDEDGRFIEIGNREEAERMLAFVDGATSDGKTYSAQSFRIPELLMMVEMSKAARVDATDARISSLMRDARTGKTLASVVLPKAVAGILRPYQVRGIEWGMFLRAYHFGGILADDMGLGKTLQALTLIAIQQEKAKGERRPSLVVCPKTLVGVWVQEAAKFFPNLKVVAIDGTQAERAAAIDRIGEADIVVASYPSLIREAASFASRKISFEYCIADEAQYMKNAATATAAAIKTISAAHRLALTGTPIENGVHELWSIFDFLMPGFLGDRKSFRTRFETPIQKKQDVEAMARLKAMTLPFMLRRTKETELRELPPKIEQIRPCALTAEQLTIYAHTLAQVKQEVFDAVEKKGFSRSRIEILAALTKLRRTCDHPALIDPRLGRSAELSGKMLHTIELVREAVAGGHKVLLFSQFTTMLDILREALDAEGVGHRTIEGKTKDRAAAVKQFTEDPETKVFLLSLKAGGTGLTLTAADTVILYDPWWNPMAERQAMDRAHRIGQEKTVNVYKLVTQGTIEERILQLQEHKKKVFDALVTENAGELEALTWEDVRGLFE